jgi:hypothetical protein
MTRAYWSRLRRSWLWSGPAAAWLALGLLPLLFFQTAVHEGSHCVAMKLLGVRCRVVAPFPVAIGRAGLLGVTESDGDAELPAAAIAAPQLVAAALVVALQLAARRTDDERWALLARLWLLGACLDLLNNTFWRPHSAGGDWSALASQLGLSTATRLALSLPLWAIGLAGLLLPIPAPRAPSRASLRDLAEIGLVYALVSTVAVVTSLAVHVPGSDRRALWHRVPILLQAASAIVCLALGSRARRSVGGVA